MAKVIQVGEYKDIPIRKDSGQKLPFVHSLGDDELRKLAMEVNRELDKREREIHSAGSGVGWIYQKEPGDYNPVMY